MMFRRVFTFAQSGREADRRRPRNHIAARAALARASSPRSADHPEEVRCFLTGGFRLALKVATSLQGGRHGRRSLMLVASLSGWWLGGVLFFIIWLLIAFWPARVASRKGHSFILYFLFSLVFFPAALIVAYMVRDRRRT